MIRKTAKLTPAFTKKGNIKAVENAKAAYEQLGWTILEEFVGNLSAPSYLVVEANEELEHPKRPIVDKVEEFDEEPCSKDARKKELQEQVGNLDLKMTTFVKREIRSLPDILDDEEYLIGLVAGFMEGNNWLVVATQHRVIMLDTGMLGRFQQKELQLKDIQSIATKSGIMNSEIDIKASGTSLKVEKAKAKVLNEQ